MKIGFKPNLRLDFQVVRLELFMEKSVRLQNVLSLHLILKSS